MVSGEAIKAPRADERRIDAPGRIEVSPLARAPSVAPAAPAPPVPVKKTALPVAPARRGGLWLVVVVYLLSGAALAYAIWERFLRS